MLRLRVAAALLVVAGACGDTTPVELRTAADDSAVVPEAPSRPDGLALLTTTTTVPPTTTTSAPPATTSTTTNPPEPEPVIQAAQAAQATPAGGGDCLGWADTIAAHFPPSEHGTACRVMRCETGGTGDPSIHNPSSSASGLWQFLDSTWRSVTGLAPPAANYSGDQQTAAAASLWASSGWSPWSCY